MDHLPCLLSSPSLFLSQVQVSSLLLDSPPLKDKHINNMYQWNICRNVNINKKENTLQSLKQKKYEQYHRVLSYLYGVIHHGLLLTNSICPTSSWTQQSLKYSRIIVFSYYYQNICWISVISILLSHKLHYYTF